MEGTSVDCMRFPHLMDVNIDFYSFKFACTMTVT
jgi:hypothetical protein